MRRILVVDDDPHVRPAIRLSETGPHRKYAAALAVVTNAWTEPERRDGHDAHDRDQLSAQWEF